LNRLLLICVICIIMHLFTFPDPSAFRFGKSESDTEIFDVIRKKFVHFTPEEWVRQHLLKYLLEKNFPASLIAVEKELIVAGIKKRTDVVVYSNNSEPLLIAECKSPDVPLEQSTFDQAARYNLSLAVPCFLLTNGLTHFCCRLNALEKKYEFLEEMPQYSELILAKNTAKV
jgi:Type I restriction enzyme R protein N terminus (HSDR_N)